MLTQILFNGTLRSLLFFTFVLINPTPEKTRVEKDETQKEIILQNHVSDIIPLTDTIVTPVLYTGETDNSVYTNAEQRERFIAMMLPAILLAKYKIAQDLVMADSIQLCAKATGRMNWEDFKFLTKLYIKYGASNPEDLRNKMQTHPTSIVLAQAGLESGWGTSRFFKQANNPFGMWSYNPSEPRIVSQEKVASGYIIYMRKYNTLGQSIVDYFATIARVNAYKKFRNANLEGKPTMELIPHLSYYCELGDYYCTLLNSVIINFDLLKYDNYKLPDSFTKNYTGEITL